MRVLFAGPLGVGETAAMRCRTLARVGHTVTGVDLTPFVEAEHGVARKLQWHLRIGRFVRAFNAALLAAASRGVDLLWVEKGVFVWPRTVERIRAAGARALIHYPPDMAVATRGISNEPRCRGAVSSVRRGPARGRFMNLLEHE